MYFTPLLPFNVDGRIDSVLLEMAEEVCLKSAALGAAYPPQVVNGIKSLLRTVNSYYSNKIESEGTHPFDIEKASRKIFSDDAKLQQLQKLSLVHIEVQEWIEELLQGGDQTTPFSKEFISDVHRKFYSPPDMEPFLNIDTVPDSTNSQNNTTIKMIPGSFRERTVYVGNHAAPEYTDIPTLFNIYESSYKIPTHSTQAIKLIYALSSHHRLTWIHPFLDGNGRTSRLVLDGILAGIQLSGYGLWNISRGLARDSGDYKKYLAIADHVRQGDLDGRGALSLKGLKIYVKFMLEAALDQVSFMSDNLQLHTLSQRMENYVKFSQQKMYQTAPLPKYSEFLLKELLIRGEMPRGGVAKVIHASDRTASTLIKNLLEMDFLESDTPKGAIRLKFNAHFASEIFPDLISHQ
ncbi:MAG: Fic family protein [Campylobacterota bacterium]|nr:Fic family protein [Campylobacterota bacterium]